MKNKDIDIYFFSGTGNTYLASKKIAEIFADRGCKVALKPMEISDPAKTDLSKTIGLGFSVACWNTYPMVRKFYENLPDDGAAEVFVFTTMGDASLKTAANAAHFLSKKGYRVIASKGFLMPNNFINVRPDGENRLKIRPAYSEMEKFVSDILDGSSSAQKANIFFRFCHALTKAVTALWLWKPVQFLIRFKLDEKKCVKCRLCFEICPAANISYKNFPSFDGNKCQLCLRCISYCPVYAIHKWFVPKTYRAIDLKEIKKCFRSNS